MTQNINLIPNEASLLDLLNYYKKLTKLEINCHHVGTITSFNAENQTAQATINYTKTFLQLDSVGDTSITPTNYAELIDCPVICLGGGTGFLTFPIQEGDECLVLFNDRDFDNWFNGSSNSPPSTPRVHGFSDAMILVGVRSLSNVIVDYDTEAVTLQMGDNYLKISDDDINLTKGENSIDISDSKVILTKGENTFEVDADKILGTLSSAVTFEIDSSGTLKIQNATAEFVTSLVTLFTDIQTGLVTTSLGPRPLVMPTFAADLALFESFKS